jgi:DNA-binding NarL/FixJ family response regulator
MALFLIIEPHKEIRPLYAAVVRGLGHDAAFFDDDTIAEPDVVLVEPGYPKSFDAALRLRLAHPDLPIVCASIHEPTQQTVRALQPSTYLLKPFSLAELKGALQLALSQRVFLSV